ncbi:AraC family transcriptional regulator [Sphingomonas sp. MG17]|uniref:AraC family transcriptional regulator n=1 Tax=Sphingomonas tagetis TaxID=2949092 RepID=A0A9X2KK01_9SPHN|nr:AraC family transcriptional regulator [Sphingomonas tagetis]MCP3728816.1 AraC family transcriptional regulator [Sphingomonas tagetis]
MQNPAIIIGSPEMTVLIGPVAVSADVLPPDPVLFAYALGAEGATLRVFARPAVPMLLEMAGADDTSLLVVARRAVERLYGWTAEGMDGDTFHVSHELAAILMRVADAGRSGDALITYRFAKSLELLCETVEALNAGSLVPFAGDGVLSERDTRAIVAARGMVDRQWSEKLTLDWIARACGINRAKLTRGFRDLYGCTISEALAERRLAEAQAKLLTTDLPVSSIGYASGYLNNASFTRAFGRRFGLSPSDFRAIRRAA